MQGASRWVLRGRMTFRLDFRFLCLSGRENAHLLAALSQLLAAVSLLSVFGLRSWLRVLRMTRCSAQSLWTLGSS